MLFPELYPQSPSIENRQPFRAFDNPYLENETAIAERHSGLRRVRRLDSGVVNGYLKFVMRSKDHTNLPYTPHGGSMGYTAFAVPRHDSQVLNLPREGQVSRVPRGFGSNARIDELDRKILRFCT